MPDWDAYQAHVMGVRIHELYDGSTYAEAHPLWDTYPPVDCYGVYVRDKEGYAYHVADYDTPELAIAARRVVTDLCHQRYTYRDILNYMSSEVNHA